MAARVTMFVFAGIGALVLLGGALLLVGVGVSAWYFWPAKSPELVDAGPRAKAPIEEPKDKPVNGKPKEKDKPETPKVVKPPIKGDIDSNIVLSISLKEPKRQVGEIFFTHTQRLCVGVYRYRVTNKESSEQFELFDVATMESVARLDMPAATYSPCPRDLGPDGKYFARGTILEGRKFSIWELGHPEPVVANWSLDKLDKSSGTWSNRLSAFHLLENDRLLTFSGAGDIQTWQIPEMKSLWKVQASRKFFLSSPIGGFISPDRQRCAVFTGDNFRIFDTQTGKLICETAPAPTKDAKALTNRSTAFSSDNAMLLASIDGVGIMPALYCYDANTGELKSRVPFARGIDHLFARVCWFGTRHFCVSANSGRGKTVVHRANDGTQVAELIPADSKDKLQVGFRSPDPRLWFATMSAQSGAVKLIAAPLPAELERGGPGAPVEFRFSDQGLNRLGVPK